MYGFHADVEEECQIGRLDSLTRNQRAGRGIEVEELELARKTEAGDGDGQQTLDGANVRSVFGSSFKKAVVLRGAILNGCQVEDVGSRAMSNGRRSAPLWTCGLPIEVAENYAGAFGGSKVKLLEERAAGCYSLSQ